MLAMGHVLEPTAPFFSLYSMTLLFILSYRRVIYGGEDMEDVEKEDKEKTLRSVMIPNDKWSWELLPDN